MKTFEEFDGIYQDAVRDVAPYCTPQAQAAIAAHCYGWSPGLFDFVAYLRASSVRFYRAYAAFAGRRAEQTVCDVGSFWGVFALTLRALGYPVTVTESLRFYGDSFQGLLELLRRRGVTVVDCDPFEPQPALPGPFDVVTVLAILEHYPHSLRTFLGNVCALLKADGRLYVDVPNIAYWPKRMALLRGQTPLVPAGHIYRSRVPFVGHHHEFTIAELRELADLAGLRILEEQFFGYSNQAPFWRRLRLEPLETLAQLFWPESREVIAVLCERRAGGNGAR